MKRNNRMFVRIDSRGKLIPGSNILRASMPKYGKWIEINADYCCPTVDVEGVALTTTTTTTSTTSTTTTTTTTATPAP